jgi:hypothetical protein
MLGRFIDRPREDSLTAAVFSHLLHLPVELFWPILRNACRGTDKLPEYPGEPREFVYWPNWDPSDTDNSYRVEPDFFIRFLGFDLIVEAKRRDNCMQSPAQWNKELTAYTNTFDLEHRAKDVRLIAIGGLWGDHDGIARELRTGGVQCPVHMCRWSDILAGCQRAKRELCGLKYPSSQSLAHRRILKDVIDLFAVHRFQTGIWFSDLVPELLHELGTLKHATFPQLLTIHKP